MTTTDPFKFSVGVTGCQNEAKLKRDITFPLGNMHNIAKAVYNYYHTIQYSVAVARSTPSESQPQCLSHTIIITG